MAEKSDDIKNLFLNLGLNPSDYHEIRSAPTANVTVSEAPRRWSLLQSSSSRQAPSPQPLQAPPVAAVKVPQPPPVVASPAAASVSAPVPAKAEAAFAASLFSEALRGAAMDIALAEATGNPGGFAPAPELPAADRAPPPSAPLPSALSEAFAQPRPNDGLQSLFQSVKEPQTAAKLPGFDADAGRPTERRTDQMYKQQAAASSLAERVAALPPAPSALLTPPPRLVDHSDEPETRHVPLPPSRLGPVPPVQAPVVAAPVAAPVPVAEGRLRFASPAPQQASTYGESLQDVFRRLSRDNRG